MKMMVNGASTIPGHVSWVVCATVPNWRFSSRSGLVPNWNCFNRLYPINSPKRTDHAVFWAVPHCRKLWSSIEIKYLSCGRITIWYIRKRCSFRCAFTSNCPIRDPMTICWVALKITSFLALFHSNSMNCGRIANWRMGGERSSKTAYCTDKLYCDMISTQIPNWIQSTEFAKLRLCSMIYLAKKTAGLCPVRLPTPLRESLSGFC
jgi:hypothetical protein